MYNVHNGNKKYIFLFEKFPITHLAIVRNGPPVYLHPFIVRTLNCNLELAIHHFFKVTSYDFYIEISYTIKPFNHFHLTIQSSLTMRSYAVCFL